ncbi:MAG: Crp/Fnr family transcriptional regulator [Actinomycetota bacterium]
MDDDRLPADRHATWLARCLGNSPASPLSPSDLEAMLAVSTVETAGSGAVLFERDDPVRDVYIVEKGKVALARPHGGEPSLLQILHPGDVFGDVGLFLGRPNPVDAIALEPVELLRLAGPDLVRLVSTRPGIAVRWMVSMAARLADAQDRLDALLAGPLDYQVASLLDHAADQGDQVTITQETLARLLGARRPSVSRSLASLEKQGLIARRYGKIELLDRPRLAALAR